MTSRSLCAIETSSSTQKPQASYFCAFAAMESALSCASSHFLSVHYYNKADALGRNFPSSCTEKFMYSNSSLTRNNSTASTRRAVISSVLGRKVNREVVIPDPDYRIPVVLLGMTGGFVYADNLVAAVPIGLLGLLLLVQATRVRFVFDGEALEVKVGDQLQDSGENVFVGGQNRWKYSTFVNWELWWPSFPILVYFKETQTKPEGQIHFFPVIFNGKQLYNALVERCGPSKTSGPK
ncbi:hypothetical protein C2S52_008212 [Perilla frutescens var. hirtella]|uniref:DUF3119 family protein n=1 Tax=Perilla frutescens var. hirtella TaxID=608512 RepID=A0AAD4JQ16_PERFH|nr:hypothetical protein C2S51_018034 [Perilla frutescens var. frutescens]KAH6783253.1 hypothetical protein C2S52_008212 [Perilla frutescens var. hirtella]KAH6837917.1 hypothetical protein C2S53_012713 [Perilla frutescens var. hirtella]